MHFHVETLLSEPVVAAVKTESALTAALASPCSTIFLLASTLVNVEGMVQRIRQAGKLAVVHIDLVDGLSGRDIAVDALIALCHPDGIISTHPTLIRRARHRGLLTIQRAFILDSLSLTTLSGQLELGKPDFVEILPGILPRIITEIGTQTPVPIIAGGLLIEGIGNGKISLIQGGADIAAKHKGHLRPGSVVESVADKGGNRRLDVGTNKQSFLPTDVSFVPAF